MNFDPDTIRAQFPALGLHDNGRRRIYFDNPAGTQVPETVIAAMGDCLRTANANLGGPFASSRAADAIVDGAHQAMADLLNAPEPGEIVFGPNMTTLAFQFSRSIAPRLQPGDSIVVTEMEHDANVTPWTLMARDRGVDVHRVRLDPERYELDLDHLDQLLEQRPRLVCVGLSSNLLGTINDVAEITRRAHAAGALVFVDAVHAVPHMAVDVQALGADLLACSPYKFFGPHQGVLWGRRELLQELEAYKVRPAPETTPGRFETGTQNHEAMAGVTAAVDYLAGLSPRPGPRREALRHAMTLVRAYEQALGTVLIGLLETIPGLTIHGITDPDAQTRRVPTVSFTVDGFAPDTLAAELGTRNIFAWSGHSYALEPCRALGLLDGGGVLRVGLVHYNAGDDIDALIEALSSIVSR